MNEEEKASKFRWDLDKKYPDNHVYIKLGHERIDITQALIDTQKQLLEEAKQTLNDFWLFHVEELSVIKDYLNDGIKAVDKDIQHFAANPKNRENDDKLRSHHEDIGLRDFLIGVRSKVEYCMTNGLYKKVKHGA